MMLVVDLGRTKIGIAFEHPFEMVTWPDKNGNPTKHRCPVATKCKLFGIREGGEPLMIARGKADCSPLDNFNKSTGRKIALTRALAKLTTLTKDERTRVWAAYLNRPRPSAERKDSSSGRSNQDPPSGVPEEIVIGTGTGS